jgi:hypothetical protein
LDQLIFPPKWCHVGLALICHFFVLDSRPKAMGPIYSSQPIGLLYFIGAWTLEPHLKWPLFVFILIVEMLKFILPFKLTQFSQQKDSNIFLGGRGKGGGSSLDIVYKFGSILMLIVDMLKFILQFKLTQFSQATQRKDPNICCLVLSLWG